MADANAKAETTANDADETFHYRINGGAESQITVRTGIYQFAVLAIPAVTGETRLPIVVEIWCPRLVPRYGPYWYEIYDNEFGCAAIRHLVRNSP